MSMNIKYPFTVSDEYKTAGLQPYLPVRIIHPDDVNTNIIVKGLIDTGALISKFPVRYAKQIVLEFKNGNLVSGLTAGGEAQAYYCNCGVEVLDMDENGQILPTKVLAVLSNKQFVFGRCAPVALLGVNDFLKDYKLTVNYPNRYFTIT